MGVIRTKMMKEDSYTFEDANNFGDGFPDRGIKCEKCKTYVPQFERFDSEEQSKWREILSKKGCEDADNYLISVTGCNHRWAKIWRLHPDGVNSANE